MDNRQFILGYFTLTFPELNSLTLFPKLSLWYGVWFLVNEKKNAGWCCTSSRRARKKSELFLLKKILEIKAVFSFSLSSVYGSSCTFQVCAYYCYLHLWFSFFCAMYCIIVSKFNSGFVQQDELIESFSCLAQDFCGCATYIILMKGADCTESYRGLI